jgi:hypothetical protein
MAMFAFRLFDRQPRPLAAEDVVLSRTADVGCLAQMRLPGVSAFTALLEH